MDDYNLMRGFEEEIDFTEAFRDFYNTFKTTSGTYKYKNMISRMPLENRFSLVVDFEDLLEYDPDLAHHLIVNPDNVLKCAKEALLSELETEDREFAQKYSYLIKVRIKGLFSKTKIREIRAQHIGRLVAVEGIIVRITPVKSKLYQATYVCRRCMDQEVTTIVKSSLIPKSIRCPNCRKSDALELDVKRSLFVDYQKAVLQEKPEELPPGQLPRAVEVEIEGDIVDVARPGDRVIVVGIVRAKQTRMEGTATLARSPVFETYIECLYVETMAKELEELMEITPEDEKQIKELAKRPDIDKLVVSSIAPSIIGLEEIKLAIALQLFGGETIETPDGTRMRGDIHILLVGDPGTAKSTLLKYVAQLAPRGVYTSGKGSTAAGLTATVLRSKATGDFYLEAGALVLADKGIACIDEIDKMRGEDRVAMHEAMEQQTISIAKAGIVATLNARASILAAANPKLGRYDPDFPVKDNVNLSVTILSRFDLIFVLRDIPDRERDSFCSEMITIARMYADDKAKLAKYGLKPPIPRDLLRKYIVYAKRTCKPKLTPEAAEKIHNYFISMRSQAQGERAPIPITYRHLDALVRLSQAHARMRLSNRVTPEDVDVAIKLLEYSLKQVALHEGRIDIDVLYTGRPRSEQKRMSIILRIIDQLEQELNYPPDGVPKDDVVTRAALELRATPDDIEKELDKMGKEGIIYFPSPDRVRKTS